MQSVNLQITPTGICPVVNVSQYDVGRQFTLALYDGSTAYIPPSGTTARIDGVKPDGHTFSYTDAVSISNNIVTITTKEQMTVVKGAVTCELRFTKNNDNIGTLNFVLNVEPSPINENTDPSDTEIPAIIDLARQEVYDSEAWAVGERNGVPVGPTDQTYHNNAKYYSDHAGGVSLDGLTDVDIQSLTNGQYIKYDSTAQKWKNTSDVAEKSNTSDFLSLSNNGTQIPDNSDLNSYITPGKYYVINSTSANTLSNAPTITGGFTMFVLERTNGTQRTQIIYMNNAGACDQYIRNHDTNTQNWSSWQKIAYNSQIQTLANDVTSLNSALTNEVNTRLAVGSHNLLPNNASSKVESGITYTVATSGDNKGTVAVSTGSGGASATSGLTLTSALSLKKGTYYLSGCPYGGGYGTYRIVLAYTSGGSTEYVVNADDGQTWFELANDISNATVYIEIFSGQVITTPITFKPMIRVSTDTNPTYTPFAMTNQQLTENLTVNDSSVQSVDISSYTSSNNQYVCPADGYVISDVPMGTGYVSVNLLNWPIRAPQAEKRLETVSRITTFSAPSSNSPKLIRP